MTCPELSMLPSTLSGDLSKNQKKLAMRDWFCRACLCDCLTDLTLILPKRFALSKTLMRLTKASFWWGNAVYSFGTCLTADFANDRWCGGLVGPEGGGLVPCLPLY